MSETENNKPDENIGSFYMGRLRRPPQPQRHLPPGLLTAVAIFALVGIVWYAYPRGSERYTDIDIPVVKADTAPIKAEPVDPGGMEVRHQDSTVFDPLEQKPAGEVEKLRPKPEEPLDKAQAIKAEEEKKPAAVEKMASKLSLDLQMKDAKSGTEKVVSKPKPKPAMPASATPKPKAETKPAAAVPAPAAAADGKVYIQLGSYRDMAGVKADWERLKKKHAQFLGSLSMKAEKIDIPGKGVFYRLYAGKLTEARAREICAVLKTANPGGCILVKGLK